MTPTGPPVLLHLNGVSRLPARPAMQPLPMAHQVPAAIRNTWLSPRPCATSATPEPQKTLVVAAPTWTALSMSPTVTLQTSPSTQPDHIPAPVPPPPAMATFMAAALLLPRSGVYRPAAKPAIQPRLPPAVLPPAATLRTTQPIVRSAIPVQRTIQRHQLPTITMATST